MQQSPQLFRWFLIQSAPNLHGFKRTEQHKMLESLSTLRITIIDSNITDMYMLISAEKKKK